MNDCSLLVPPVDSSIRPDFLQESKWLADKVNWYVDPGRREERPFDTVLRMRLKALRGTVTAVGSLLHISSGLLSLFRTG